MAFGKKLKRNYKSKRGVNICVPWKGRKKIFFREDGKGREKIVIGVIYKPLNNPSTCKAWSIPLGGGGHIKDAGIASQVQRQGAVAEDAIAHILHGLHCSAEEA
jgi:hypothetical protein